MLELTVRLIASLAVVVGLLLLLARFGGRRFRGRSGDLVRIVHRQPLSRTSSVAVVSVGSRVLVLGTTEQQVSILTELGDDEIDLDGALVAEQLDELDGEFDGEIEGEEILELPAAIAPLAVAPAAPVAAQAAPSEHPAAPATAFQPFQPPAAAEQARAAVGAMTSQSLFEAITRSAGTADLTPRRPAAHRARLTHLDDEVVPAPAATHDAQGPSHRLSAAATPQQPLEPTVVEAPAPAAAPGPVVGAAEDFRPVTARTMNAVLAALAASDARQGRPAGAAEQLLDEESWTPRAALPVEETAELPEPIQQTRVEAPTQPAGPVEAATRAARASRAASRAASRRGARTGYVGEGPLAGSVLSVSTWRQAFAAATGKAS